MCRYGHFSEDGTAFVVTDPATPRPFDNFLWNDVMFSCVHQTGVGYCDVQVDGREAVKLYTGIGRVCDIETFGRDHLMSRLVYIRDNDTGEFWNVGWEPVCHSYESYECVHGLGYTRISSQVDGITASVLTFIPPGDDPVELWKLTVANRSGRPRSLGLFLYNQYSIQYKWGFESYGDMIYRGSWFDAAQNALIVQKHPYVAPHEYLTGFMAANRPVAAYDGTRSAFAGDYNTLASPRAVVEGACSNTPGSADSTVGALQFNLELPAGADESVEIVNGMVDNPAHIGQFRTRFLGHVDDHFHALASAKQRLVARNAVTTPDPHFNRMANAWLKQQTLFGATWARWGYMGYRDIVQHGFGVSSFAPERTRAILVEALRHQYSSGLALRGWNPVDTKAYSDSSLWLVFTLCAYLKETGDFDLLAEPVPYFDETQDTVLAHIETALGLLDRDKGAHGLCLIRFGDWNDSLTGIGREGRGESVWLSMAYVHALDQMAELHSFHGPAAKTADYRRRATTLRSAIRDQGWDGDWFVRCFDDNGQPVGSNVNAQGRIYLNTQSWALIAGIADAEREAALIAACDRHLLLDVGYRLLTPPYLERDDHIGRISYMEPGICENGSIYSHGNAWMFLALLTRGLGDRAYDVFKRVTPGYIPGSDSPKQRIPPYIYANGYYGPEHRNNPLQAEFTWITGSAAWWYNALLDHMIGIRREYDGLTIDPVLPTAWDEVSIVRTFRGKTFNAIIKRTGERTVCLNGNPIDGQFVPLCLCDQDNEITATL